MISNKQIDTILFAITEITNTWCHCDDEDVPHISNFKMIDILGDCMSVIVADHEDPIELFNDIGTAINDKIDAIRIGQTHDGQTGYVQ